MNTYDDYEIDEGFTYDPQKRLFDFLKSQLEAIIQFLKKLFA